MPVSPKPDYRITPCTPEDEKLVFQVGVCIPGVVMREHKQLTSAGFRHLRILVYLTREQDYVIPCNVKAYGPIDNGLSPLETTQSLSPWKETGM